jgi:hypothetical protein
VVKKGPLSNRPSQAPSRMGFSGAGRRYPLWPARARRTASGMLPPMPARRIAVNPFRFVPLPSTDGTPDIHVRAPTREDLDEVKARAERDAARRGCQIEWQESADADGGLEARGVTRAIAPS